MGRTYRPYELSIFSLQDEFITVLKEINVDNLLQVHEPKLTIKDDGTQELKFSIPMFYRENNILVENPLWKNTQNGNIIVGLRKVRVCFNKNTDKQKIYDFVITKVTEKHDKGTLFCEVEAEGIAFQELGKIGYKITLNQDEFDVDYEKWWNDENRANLPEPIASLNYWCDKIFAQVKNWNYKIDMDWSMYGNSGRESTKVYEDEYISDWKTEKDIIKPVSIANAREKARIPSCEKSNVYNITQELAELFNVFCRYEYSYDNNGHITGRTCVFYNNFLMDNNPMDIFYNFDTDEISREMDCSELITKMYVVPIDDTSRLSGQINIMECDANKMREDYLLNFDYMYSIGAINDIQYKEIEEYESAIRQCNLQLEQLSSEINQLTIVNNELEADLSSAQNEKENAAQIKLDTQATIDKILTKITGADNPDATEDNKKGFIERIRELAIAVAEDGKDTFYLSLKDTGVQFNEDYPTIKLEYYPKTSDGTISAPKDLKEITLAYANYYKEAEYDEYGALKKIHGFSKPNDWRETTNYCFLTYTYRPTLQYDKVMEMYTNVENNAIKEIEQCQKKLDENNVKLEAATKAYNSILEQKNKLIYDFDGMMGPALKEGYWQDDDYKDYGSRRVENLSIGGENNEANMCKFITDIETFDGEENDWYTEGADENKVYKLGLKLDNIGSIDISKWNEIVFMYSTIPLLTEQNFINTKVVKHEATSVDDQEYWMFMGSKYNTYAEAEAAAKEMYANKYKGQSQDLDTYIYLNSLLIEYYKDGDNIYPVAFFPDNITLADIYKYADIVAPGLYYRTIENDVAKLEKVNNTSILNNNTFWLMPDYAGRANSNIVRYRIRMDNSDLKTEDENFFLKQLIGEEELELVKYQDYSILYRDMVQSVNDYQKDMAYYITIKPLSIWKNAGKIQNNSDYVANKYLIQYVLSTATLQMYLDALQVMKTNCFPQVSYEVKLKTPQEDFINYTYNYLGSLCRIDDPTLSFHNVMGYISELNLSLDKPWDDDIKIKNYKTRFEDLFGRIVASTEQMKLNGVAYNNAAQAFNASGELKNLDLSKDAEKDLDEKIDERIDESDSGKNDIDRIKSNLDNVIVDMLEFNDNIKSAADNADARIEEVDTRISDFNDRISRVLDNDNNLAIDFDFTNGTTVTTEKGIQITNGKYKFLIDGKSMGFYEGTNQTLGFTSSDEGTPYFRVNGVIIAEKGGKIGGLSIQDDGTLGSPYLTLGVDKNENTVFAIKNKAGKGLMSLTANTDGEYLLNIEGYINALGGTIGGFTINGNNLSSDYMIIGGNQFEIYNEPQKNVDKKVLLGFTKIYNDEGNAITDVDGNYIYNLKVEGNIVATSFEAKEKNGSYFKVDSSTMGFFDVNNKAMLSYDGNHMTLNGNINAAGGTIGGFIINEKNLSNSDNSIVLDGAAGPEKGINIGSGIITFTPKDKTIMAIYDEPVNVTGRNCLFRIYQKEYVEGDTGIDTDDTYYLSMSGLSFEKDAFTIENVAGLEEALSNATSIIKYDGKLETLNDLNSNQVTSNLLNGSIVLSYKLQNDNTQPVNLSGISTLTPTPSSSYDTYKKKTYNGIRLFSWNCPGGSGTSSHGTSLLQVGACSSDVQYGVRLIVKFVTNNEATTLVPKFSLNFHYKNNNVKDSQKSAERRSSTVKVFEDGTTTIIKDKKTFTLNGANYDPTTITFESTDTVKYYTNVEYRLIISSTNTYSAFWICNGDGGYTISVSAEDVSDTSNVITPMLWVKSGGAWYKLASGEKVTA